MFKSNDRCLLKVADDEPIFVLRAQDFLAPLVVRFWITLAKMAGMNPNRLDEAHDIARLMECWPSRKMPD